MPREGDRWEAVEDVSGFGGGGGLGGDRVTVDGDDGRPQRAHLTVVFALAIARHPRNATGMSIKKIVRTLRPLRTVTIGIGKERLTAAPMISPDARTILDALPPINAPGH